MLLCIVPHPDPVLKHVWKHNKFESLLSPVEIFESMSATLVDISLACVEQIVHMFSYLGGSGLWYDCYHNDIAKISELL